MDRKLIAIPPHLRVALASVALVCAFAISARAATPQLSSILPRGVQRGTEADIDLQGDRMTDAKEVLIYSPGITVTQLETKDGKTLHAHIRVDKDARLGEYRARPNRNWNLGASHILCHAFPNRTLQGRQDRMRAVKSITTPNTPRRSNRTSPSPARLPTNRSNISPSI